MIFSSFTTNNLKKNTHTFIISKYKKEQLTLTEPQQTTNEQV